MQKITPFLWFNGNAEAAAKFYTSVFKKSKIRAITRYGKEASKGSGQRVGSVMTIEFDIEGQPIHRLEWRPEFQIQRIHFVCRALQNASGVGLLLEKTH
jgi:predicted 3-demethylubiquinone-9 3-methyltransferase (glyoxalase superfamily)